MGGLGVVLGSGAAGLDPGDGAVVLDRHGDPYTLPHLIDHEANLQRLQEAGCDRVLGIASVGGLRPELIPGTFVCPHDFIALDLPPLTTHADPKAHRVPGFDQKWRRRVVSAFASEVDLRSRGVYWQATGPRLETVAEVRLVAPHADVIGMTVASECIVAGELGLAYAAICLVDNLANGVAATELTLAEVEAAQQAHRAELQRVMAAVMPGLSGRLP
jgi:5'-methylthioadenosine phosphorylase